MTWLQRAANLLQATWKQHEPELASASQATLPILCNVPGGLPEPALGSVPLITPNRYFLHE